MPTLYPFAEPAAGQRTLKRVIHSAQMQPPRSARMRRRACLVIVAFGAAIAGELAWLAGRAGGDVFDLPAVVVGVALGCGALSLRFMRPMLRAASREATAAALLASATLVFAVVVLELLSGPTVRDAISPTRLIPTIGVLIGLAVATPALVAAWREVQEVEWKPLALSALALAVTLAPGGDLWFPLVGVIGVQAWAFVRCIGLAWERDAIVGLGSG